MNFPVIPTRMALINVDMQNIFVDRLQDDGLALLECINGFAAVCREAGILVIHTREIVRNDASKAGVLGEILPNIPERFNIDAPSAALHPNLVVDERDIILDKPRYGAFYATDLELILRSQAIDTVVITGLTTSVCCETTAREAMVRNFRVFFLSDGTGTQEIGGLSAEEVQRASLATLGALFAQVLSMDEMIEKIQRAAVALAI